MTAACMSCKRAVSWALRGRGDAGGDGVVEGGEMGWLCTTRALFIHVLVAAAVSVSGAETPVDSPLDDCSVGYLGVTLAVESSKLADDE